MTKSKKQPKTKAQLTRLKNKLNVLLDRQKELKLCQDANRTAGLTKTNKISERVFYERIKNGIEVQEIRAKLRKSRTTVK